MRTRSTPRAPFPEARALALATLVLVASSGCSKKTTAPAPQGHITGKVVDAYGPVNNLDVSLSEITSGLASLQIATTDASGTFSFSNLRNGKYVLYSHDFSDHCAADTATVPDTAAIVLTLKPGGVVRGMATLTGRADHRGTIVYPELLLALASTDSTGFYQLLGIPPGTWTLTMTASGFADGHAQVTVPAPGDTVIAPATVLVPGTPTARLLPRR